MLVPRTARRSRFIDPFQPSEIRRLVKEEEIAVVLIEHAIEFVMTVSDRIVVLNDGKVIADGTPMEVRGNREVLEAYLGH